MPMAHALARVASSMKGILRGQKGGGERPDAPETTQKGSAKFRYGVARAEQSFVLNFDLTPFASITPFASTAPFAATRDLSTTNHIDPKYFEKVI